MITGAPYAPLRKEKIKIMLQLLKPKKGEKLVDLGSGDGRIILHAAKLGIDATGLEINPILYLLTILRIRKNNLKTAHVYLKDFWKVNLSEYKYVTIYGITFIMPGLEKKLKKELKKGAKVATSHFTFPNWEYSEKKGNVYIYTKK